MDNDELMMADFGTDYNPDDIEQINVNELLQVYNRSVNFP